MASGDTFFVFTPLDNEPPASNFAVPDLRNERPVLDFDDTVNESVIFSGVMPQNYSGGGIKARMHVTAEATSGDLDFDGAFEDASNQDLDADGFAAAKSTDNTTVPATSGNEVIIEISFLDGAEMDNVGAGDHFRFKLTRDAVSDTAVGDANLLKLELREA